MRVSLDSNVWEVVFRSDAPECLVIRDALATKGLEGFICEAAFRIEAIRKKERSIYFAQPKLSVSCPGTFATIGGKPHIHLFSIGPDDKQHPGLPAAQANSLRFALATGVRLMRTIAWMDCLRHLNSEMIQTSLPRRLRTNKRNASSDNWRGTRGSPRSASARPHSMLRADGERLG